jgi:hypothetical protein
MKQCFIFHIYIACKQFNNLKTNLSALCVKTCDSVAVRHKVRNDTYNVDDVPVSCTAC